MMNKIGKIILAGILITFLFVGCAAITEYNDTEYIVTITDKERVNNGDTSKYLVFADDEHGNPVVFKNTDSIFRGKLNSSNMQGLLREGEKYRLTVVGYRIPFLSAYQNIIKAEQITE